MGQITPTHLDGGGTLTQATSYNSNSITPAANDLILVSIESFVTSGSSNVPSVSGCGLTWVLVDSVQNGVMTAAVFRGLGTPTSGQLTFSFGGQTQHDINYSIDQFAGVDTSGSNGAGAVAQHLNGSGTAASPSLSLSTLKNNNDLAFGFVGVNAGGTTTSPGSGFTQLFRNQNLSTEAQAEYQVGVTTVNWSITASVGYAAIALEIKAATLNNLQFAGL